MGRKYLTGRDLDLHTVTARDHRPGRRTDMALVRWEPIREISSIQNEVNRLFDTFFDAPAAGGRGEAMPRRWTPAMDLTERDGAFVLRADLPGVSQEDVSIEL